MIILPENSPLAFVYGCSGRKGGNSDFATFLLEGELADQGVDFDTAFLRDYKFHPCRGCQLCSSPAINGALCVFSGKDEASVLFEPMLGARQLFFIAPIYFYHLPSLFKGLIDRAQAYWVKRSQGAAELENLPKGKAHVILISAREKGEKIFQGSLLSLRFFLEPFNIELAEPLLLRGFDGAQALASSKTAQEQVIAYTRQACREGQGL